MLGERLDLWRTGRMPWMIDAEDDYLLSGFESHPGRHPWQGEHIGKWLHAATLAYEQTHDTKLLEAMQNVVKRLLRAQEPGGYMGTYGPETRFTAMPENVSLKDVADDIAPQKKSVRPSKGWDTWTFRYNLYGLLTYERFHPDPRIVDACRRMADLLIEVYGEGKYDLTKYGTRQGISATTLLESIVMLYERTQDGTYLTFAEHIVAMSEAHEGLRLMGTMLAEGSVVGPGEGKAYQLMANLLGYLRLYRNTGDERYLRTVQNAWQDITANHLDVAGGPWGRHMDYNGNRECFAHPRDFDPAAADVETCSTTTWVQLNLHMLELTGEARYATEAERAVFNALLAAQHENGLDWCYYTRTNQNRRPYAMGISCCSSSGPRALEMFSRYLVGEVEGGIAITSLVPCSVVLPDSLGGARITVTGDYPVSSGAAVRFEETDGREFALQFREPFGSRLKSARINGREITPSMNERGFYRISRAWTAGDELAIEFEYQLQKHLAAPVDKPVWVAFTYGPWALSETMDGSLAGAAEPCVGKAIPESALSGWLQPQTPGDDGVPAFRIKDTDIVLGPYYSAGSKTTGPRTYFGLVPADSMPRPAVSKSRKSTPRAIDISEAVAKFAPGWSVSNCGDAMRPGLASSFRGRPNVLVTHPRDTETPCTLARTVDIPAGKKTVLKVVVSHHQRGDWLLALKIDGQPIHAARTISAATCPDGWLTVDFDLSDWAGQTVKLELLNQATAWNYEAGYWAEIAIVSK
ncbi:MAG: beta-L-arabinofuranosidase domain-containing protein [Planctomycetota bacterium]